MKKGTRITRMKKETRTTRIFIRVVIGNADYTDFYIRAIRILSA